MAKLYTMLTFLTVTDLLFNLAGVMTPSGWLLTTIMNPNTFFSSGFYLVLYGLVVITAGAVVIGSFIMNFATNAWQIQASTLVLFWFFPLLVDLISIWQKVAQFSNAVAMIVCAPLLIAWILGIQDWWRSFQ